MRYMPTLGCVEIANNETEFATMINLFGFSDIYLRYNSTFYRVSWPSDLEIDSVGSQSENPDQA